MRAPGKLVLFLADSSTLDIPLERERVTVGRRPTSDVCLPYAAVSGAHAVFVRLLAGTVMEDLGSTNGTLVNGKRTARHFLHDGDRIDIGQQKLLYFADANRVVPPVLRRETAGEPAGEVAGAEPGGGAGDAAVGPVPAAPGGVSAEAEQNGSPTPSEASAVPIPAASVQSWLSQPGLADSPDVGGAEVRAPANHAPDGLPSANSPPPPHATARAPAGPVLRVLSGPSAGRRLVLTGDEALIGRIGVQVVAVRRADDGHRLVLAEGADAPQVNGIPVPAEGVLLQSGDAVEIAGARLVFQKDGRVVPS